MTYIFIALALVGGYFLVTLLMIGASGFDLLMKHQMQEILKKHDVAITEADKSEIILEIANLCREHEKEGHQRALTLQISYHAMTEMVLERAKIRNSA